MPHRHPEMLTSVVGAARKETCAQATVEMAVIAPVMLVLVLIVYNVMVFLAATARFDRVAPDIVVAHGVSPAATDDGASAADASPVIDEQLERAMEGYDVEVDVTCEQGDGDGGGAMLGMVGALRTYRCTMRFAPWPQRLSIAGVSLGAPIELSHERAVTVDPWRPGVVV